MTWNSDHIFQFLCCWYISNVKVYSIFEFQCCLEVLERPNKTNLLIFNSIQTCLGTAVVICFYVFMLLDVVRYVDLEIGLYISLNMLLDVVRYVGTQTIYFNFYVVGTFLMSRFIVYLNFHVVWRCWNVQRRLTY